MLQGGERCFWRLLQGISLSESKILVSEFCHFWGHACLSSAPMVKERGALEWTGWCENPLGCTGRKSYPAGSVVGSGSKASLGTEEWGASMCCIVPRHKNRDAGCGE